MDKTLMAIIFFATIIWVTICVLDSMNRETDPIAQRIDSIEEASFGMSESAKKELILEALKSSTNQVPNKIILEK